MMRKPTISDVAREADVSKSTVSRVINNVPNVADDLRERVEAAIDKLDYQPSRAARSLKKNLQDVVGFLVPSISDTIFGSVLQGAEDFAYENNMGILPYSTADNLKRQQMYLEMLQADQPAGIVLVPAPETNPRILQSMQAQGIPIVLLDRKLQGFEADLITTNNFQGAYTAVTHLAKQGYSRIATIAGDQNVSTGLERLNGYQVALADARLASHPEWIQYGNFDQEGSYNALHTLLRLHNPPDAVFVANDAMTIGALRAIRDQGVRVPHDLAVVGFDEMALSELLNPSLTTIEQPTEALGSEALRLLFDRIQQPHRLTRTVQIPPSINIRESTRNSRT